MNLFLPEFQSTQWIQQWRLALDHPKSYDRALEQLVPATLAEAAVLNNEFFPQIPLHNPSSSKQTNIKIIKN